MKLFRLIDRLHRFTRSFGPDRGEPSGVLLLNCGGLGDTVLFSHVLPKFMALANKGETATVLMRNDGAKTSFLFPKSVSTLTVDFKQLRRLGYRKKILNQLYQANYRMVVHTDFLRHPDLDEALVAAADAPETAAMEPRSWPKYDKALSRNRALYRRLYGSGPALKDKILRWNDFANWLCGTDSPAPKALTPTEQLPEPATKSGPLVLIQPFSAVKLKQSPVALYKKIIQALPEGTDIRLTGAPGDLNSNPDYRPLLDLPGVTFDDSTFEGIMPALRAADLVISVDTAMMHLAVAAGAPTLCLGSAAYVGEIVPYAPETTPPNVRFLYQTMPCEGCLGDCSLPLDRGMFHCVAQLSEETVLAAVREMLET
ncbi:MAG: lipopolysaccharide heptosyltransferase family protein [Rhodospirillales bacterium]|nr:lipopolysaccharide heptosyltransferase family protein [Rhodospirillales bacterium]